MSCAKVTQAGGGRCSPQRASGCAGARSGGPASWPAQARPDAPSLR